MIELGNKVRDTITGFEGVVVGMTEWINGCRRYCVIPTLLGKEGKPIEDTWFDEQRLRLVAWRVSEVAEPASRGGPTPSPPIRDPKQ